MAKNSVLSTCTWFRYLNQKLEYSITLSTKSNELDDALRCFNLDKMTRYMFWNQEKTMAPAISGHTRTLLLRHLPEPNLICVSVGDVVLLNHPLMKKAYMVRRLAAIEGYEMVSNDEKDQPFVLDKDECWVLADNKNLKPQDAIDSRIFGPVPITNIVGRVIYCLRTASDHGPVKNSELSMQRDSPVLEVELDIDEMVRAKPQVKNKPF